MIPIVVDAPGKGGTSWSSDLWLYNPSAEATSVKITRAAAPARKPLTVLLAGHASARVSGVLPWLGGGASGDGVTHDAVLISSPYRWGENLVAVSRTGTPSLDPDEKARGGTLGQGVVGVPAPWGHTNHLPAGLEGEFFSSYTEWWPSLLILDTRVPGRYRHNIGVVNVGDAALTVTLQWGWCGLPCEPEFNPPGEGERASFSVPPHTVTVRSVEDLFPSLVRMSRPASVALVGDAPAAIWYSLVDNRTGDGTHVPAPLLDSYRGHSRSAIPVAAHLPGSHGTSWVTDLYAAGQYRAYFHPAWPSTSCGGVPEGGELSAWPVGVAPLPGPAGDTTSWRIFPDVVRSFPGCGSEANVRGALELEVLNWMEAFARTYTTRADGGTYGEMLPLYPYYGWPVQHFAGIEIGAQFRVNLGLYNGDKDHAITHRLSLYKADGTLYAQRELVLKPWESIQERIEKMLGVPYDSIPAGTYGLTVLPLDDKEKGLEGRSWAYVSLVDNVTGDPTNWW